MGLTLKLKLVNSLCWC